MRPAPGKGVLIRFGISVRSKGPPALPAGVEIIKMKKDPGDDNVDGIKW